MDMTHVFMTGSTGFIGSYTLKELAGDGHTITALVRSQAKWEQLGRQMGLTDDQAQRIKPVLGDLRAPGLGLTPADRARALQADVIIHAGGPMDILLDEEEARTVFLQAAAEVLSLASEIQAQKGLRHFIHVVGFKSPLTEGNFRDPAQHLARLQQEPPYERMKFLADLLIRQGAEKAGFPLSVVHPSVVIGSSEHGETTQTGGLGILVKSAARNLMGLIPGGASHWLPLVHVDRVAAFLGALAKESSPRPDTYYLLDERAQNPSMRDLVTGITKELRVAKPIGSIPPRLLAKALNGSIGRALGIPKESLDFIVHADQTYPLASTRAIQRKYGLVPNAVNADILPATIADLDFQLVHPRAKTSGYVRGRRGTLALLERGPVGAKSQAQGESTEIPILFVHGTLSGADCLLPLADQFPESTVCLVDLPGFGRSPYHHGRDLLEGHIEALVEAICSFRTPVRLVGHSLGGLLAARASERVPELIHSLHLLQPVLHSAPAIYRRARFTEAVLRRLQAPGLEKQLLAQSCFTEINEIPQGYVAYLLEELQSPRVRKTTAQTLAALTRAESFRLSLQALKQKVAILWGTEDRVYRLPESFRSLPVLEIPVAHSFPLSQPELTAVSLRKAGL